MYSFNKVNFSPQKIKSKSLGQNQVNLVNHLVKEAETLMEQAVRTNVILQKNNLKNCKIQIHLMILPYCFLILK